MSKSKLYVTNRDTIPLLKLATRQMEKEGYSKDEIEKMNSNALSGNYYTVLTVVKQYFELVPIGEEDEY